MKPQKSIKDILKNNLNVIHSVKSIESLFENERLIKKIDYTPYYQRNYVWDKQKATYFIESILIGTEIPPLVFFKSDNLIEVIDGRQRFETIKKFIDSDLHLVKSGLDKLDFLNKKNFNDLHPDVQEIFRNTKLRIFEFSLVNSNNISEYNKDLIKKEIFRRYNSGITPLKRTELEKAIYIEDGLNSFFKDNLKKDFNLYETTINLFLGKRLLDKIYDVDTIEIVLSKIRQLLVATDIPIKRLSAKGRSLVEKYYNIFSENNSDYFETFENFKNTVSILNKIKILVNKISRSILDNPFIYETLYWAIEVIKKEKAFVKEEWSEEFLIKIVNEINKNQEVFSMENPLFYKTMNDRYKFVSKLFKDKEKVNFKLFIETNKNEYNRSTSNFNNSSINYLESINLIRINKPEPSIETIEDIGKKIQRSKFLIRPIYQRNEVINKKKSSSLIESILLGIKIPPIFIFKRDDGIFEVVDGQQRLLSIIGFIGKEFMDENGKMMKSNKNLFKLNGLNILTDLEGKKFHELSEDLQDKILEFDLSLVTIESKINPNFDPIDLFIRLNNKPYPIRENSFEMWNSYIDRNFIKLVRENVKLHSSWFYLRNPIQNYRMDNEQCYTILIYFFYKLLSKQDNNENIKFYQRGTSINARLKDRNKITKVLEEISINKEIESNIIDSIKEVESFIITIKIIISNNDSIPLDLLKNEFSNLLNLKTDRRTMQSFYVLWHILNKANIQKLTKDSSYTKSRIKEIFSLTKEIDEKEGLVRFNEAIKKFKREFSNE